MSSPPPPYRAKSPPTSPTMATSIPSSPARSPRPTAAAAAAILASTSAASGASPSSSIPERSMRVSPAGPAVAAASVTPVSRTHSHAHAHPSTASSSSFSSTTPPLPIPDAPSDAAAADLPLTMHASAILTALPRDAKRALEDAELGLSLPPGGKVTIHFHSLLHAPPLKQTRFKISASQPFGAVVRFLRKRLGLKDAEGVFCYVGKFSPGLDEGVGGLWRCFKTGEELKVGYSITPVFG